MSNDVREVTQTTSVGEIYDRIHDGVGFSLKEGGYWEGGIDEDRVHVEPAGDGFWRVIVPDMQAPFCHEVCGKNAEERAFNLAAKKARARAEN